MKNEDYGASLKGSGVEGADVVATGASRQRRVLHRCGICGQFVRGGYPMGFYCDHHCWRCTCWRCPGVDGAGVYRVEMVA